MNPENHDFTFKEKCWIVTFCILAGLVIVLTGCVPETQDVQKKPGFVVVHSYYDYQKFTQEN